MAKLFLLFPKFALKSKGATQDAFYGPEHYAKGTGAFSDWHYNKNQKQYAVCLAIYWIITVALAAAGVGLMGAVLALGIAILAIAAIFGILSLISTIGFVSCKGAYKKYELSEELYSYTKSVGDSLDEYKRCLNQLQAKFTLQKPSNQSGQFGFATSLYDEFFDTKELSVYDVKYKEFTKAMNYTYSSYEGYVSRTLQSILENYKDYELGQLQESDELKIDYIVNNYPELEKLYNELDKINKKYQAKILYLYEEDQSLYNNLEILSRLKNTAGQNTFSGERKYADKGMFVDLYKKYDEYTKKVEEQSVKAYEDYQSSIGSKMQEVAKNLDIDMTLDTKVPLVFTTRNEHLDSVNELKYKKDECERKIHENIDRVDLVLSRLDERVNILRKSDTVAEVDFFETLLNTCDIDEINVKITRIFQMLKRLRQQADDYNKVVEESKDVIRKEVFEKENLNIDSVPRRVQSYIDEKVDVRSFISELNVQLQIDEIKKRLHTYPIYLYSVYVANDDIDQVMKSAVRGYKFDGVDSKKNNILHICARNNAVRCFEYFYKRVESKALDVNSEGETPLDIAYRTSQEIFNRLSRSTVLQNDYQVKYHDYQIKANLDTQIMSQILNAQADYWEYMAKNSSNPDVVDMCKSNADEALEFSQAYEEEGPNKFAKMYDLRVIASKYEKILGLVKNRENTEKALRYLGILRKYEAYYDKKIIDIFEKDLIDAIELLNTKKIDTIYVSLKNYLAANKSSYVTSLYKTEYQQNDLMLSTNMVYIERAMIGVYSCQNILTLINREEPPRTDKLGEYVTTLKKEYIKTLEQLYEETPNRYAYRLLAEEDRAFAQSHDENDIYYKLLGVTRQSSIAEIKKAYKRQILAHHRDRGGDSSKVALINDAYAKLLLEKEA